MKIEDKVFCAVPWNMLHVTATRKFGLCCLSPWEDDEPKTFEEHWNSEKMKAIRVDMMNFKPKHEICERCLEHKNIETPYSYWQNRQADKFTEEIINSTLPDGTTTFLPTTLDIRTDLCNFKCRMCYADASTSIRQEIVSFRERFPSFHLTERGQVESFANVEMSDDHLKRIKHIVWAGGEPFMSPIHWKVMDKLLELGNFPTVYYNTNMSFPGKTLDKAINVLKRFPNVIIAASIDGAGEDVEYIREGLKYDRFLENLAKLKTELPHVQFSIGYTATSMGLITLSDIIILCDEENLKFEGRNANVNFGNHLGINALRETVFDSLMEKALMFAKGTKIESDIISFVGYLRSQYKPWKIDYPYIACQEEMRGKQGYFLTRMNGLLNNIS
jgi:sulfatase maturation enzyme AslB (radical SAM superfamily)